MPADKATAASPGAARGHVVDVPHLVFATAIAGWCAWFCFDAWQAQRDVENLIMIVPASVAAVVFYGFVAAGCVRRAEGPAEPARRAIAPGVGWKIAGTMVLLAAYAVAGPAIGFDVASFAFVLLMLLMLGERRVWMLVLVPAVFCLLAIYCFAQVLATPLPLLLFPEYGQ